MMLSTSFGHADVLLWFIEIFLFVVWFWLLINVFTDLFRDHETSGGAKALWVVFLLFFPYIGVLAYLIVMRAGYVLGLDGWIARHFDFQRTPVRRALV